MELTWEEWKAMKKGLRRKLGVPGWTLLVYYLIMNVLVLLWVFAEAVIIAFEHILSGNMATMEDAIMASAESGWGYFLAAAVGFFILLLWKKPCFFKEEIFAKGRPMTVGTFAGILSVFLGGQFLSQLMLTVAEALLNLFNLSIMEGAAAISVDPDNFSMFLYAGLLAPVAEEILFRGLILRSLMPFGKRFAVFCSAFTFGLFHGNLIQTPFAFLVGLVLGYVAAEYSVFWAMLLHMINNLVVADSLSRLTQSLPVEAANLVLWAILLLFTVSAVVVLIRNRQAIRQWKAQETVNRTYLHCFFSSFGMICFMIVMGIMMVMSLYLMVTPL